MKKYKIIILGGGASGCMCAMATKEKSVAIIDANNRLAKKILVTGNGRCNLTNLYMSSSFFNVDTNKYLSRFNEKDVLKFFENIGLECYSDEEGRVYPLSNSAKSVQDVIIRKLDGKVDFFGEEKIEMVMCKDNAYFIKTDKGEYIAEKLVIATGGNSLSYLKNIDIKVKEAKPCLVALKTKSIKDLGGIKLSNVKVTARNSKGKTMTDMGEVLFKEQGLSGIVVFNISTLFARSGEFKGNASIDLLPDINIETLIKTIERRKNLSAKTEKLFVGMFQNAVASEIFKQSGIDTNKLASKLTSKEIEKLSKTIKNLSFDIVDSYDNNQIFTGGVNLKDLTNNLEHIKYKNLYFIGEACNVDGECGGYNLQWAWTSGKIVGDNLC